MKKRSNQKLSFFTKLLIFINCAIALALLISYLAPVIDPRKFWVVAFFGLAYPPLLLTNVLFAVFWLIKRSKWALISVIVILIGYNVLLNNIGFSFWSDDNSERKAGNMRVMTYNVHNFKLNGVSEDHVTRHGMLKIIAEVNPDVIGIQEYLSRKSGPYAIKDSLNKILKTTYLHTEGNQENEHEIIGMAIFSRYPIVSKGRVAIAAPGSGVQCIYADIKKGQQIIRFYSVHLQSVQFATQDYQYLDTVTKRGKADLSSTRRLAGKLKRAFLKRAEQVIIIKEHAAQCPYPYIISGDFNDTPSSFAVNQMAKGIKNTFREKGFGLGRTYNGDFPNYQIDYIMASNRFEALSYNIVKQKLSDHYPIYADLVLK
nr:endonuclease/exonuclease/phosphatase family protein [uncultured Mucilaginibacter sp.]